MCSIAPGPTTTIAVLVAHSIWEWACSSEAGNLGSILSGVGTLLFLGLAFSWVKEKRAEKKSDVAEYAMDNLYVFLDEIKTWLKFANSWIVYSRHSEANALKRDTLPEKEKKEFIENLDKDKYEANNHCKSGYEIIKILQAIIYRVKRLSDLTIDEKLAELHEHARKLPDKLFDVHFINNSPEDKNAAREYLRNSSDIIEKNCLAIHDLLMEHLMFKKKRKIKS